jgi:C_GCAxxG_C_C family probable redox protein
MEKRKDFAEKAVSSFKEGFICAESVLMAMQEFLGLEKNPALATGFGAGIARRGSVCGAVTGGILAINLKYGRQKAEDKESIKQTYIRALEFYKKFEEKMGSAICYDIIKCDLTTEEGQKIFKEKNLLEEKCFKCVETSVNILLDMLKGES